MDAAPHAKCKQLIDSFYQQPKTFSLQSNIIGDVWKHEQKLAALSQIQAASGFVAPKADLTHPETHLQMIYDVQSDPTLFVFGFRLRDQKTPMRRFIQDYNLPKRQFLGPTSMDNELAIIMCNLAHVAPGDLVYDPFCGTCSILIAATSLGA